MTNKTAINSTKRILLICACLTVVTLAVFWRVNYYDFINFDDNIYITQNPHIQSGITPDGVLWAFSTRYANLYHPLIWLSFMFDYKLYGVHAGGYHLTNLILHLLSTLLLFWLFCRMTGAVWKSAFVAALFALHPLHVESVAWIAERKDVLSAFFWMLTLCLYVYYTEKPHISRYLLVFFPFVLALLSKPMVITLPIVMLLLDYWPLSRFRIGIQSQETRTNSTDIEYEGIKWLNLLGEKIPFFILSAVLVMMTFYNQNAPDITETPDLKYFSLFSRLANAPVALITYLAKTFWPHDMTIFYPFNENLPLWQVAGTSLLIIAITTLVIVMAKRLPHLFVGWFWFLITIAPVIGIIQISLIAPYSMADRYHYLPSIGIAVMLAWGVPSLIKSELIRQKLLFPAVIVILALLSVITWRQCGYWKNSIEIWSHALQVTKNNYLAYNNRAIVYNDTGRFPKAVDDYTEAIRLKPDYAYAYNNRGNAYNYLGQHQRAIEDYNQAISIRPHYANAYKSRGVAYFALGNNEPGCLDAQRACELGKCKLADFANNKGLCR